MQYDFPEEFFLVEFLSPVIQAQGQVNNQITEGWKERNHADSPSEIGSG